MMGSFNGHALPGTFFICFSIWWTVNQVNRYYKCHGQNQVFRSTPIYPFSCGRFKFPLFEPVLKLCMVLTGIIGEMYEGYSSSDKKFIATGNIQHLTMYLAVAINCVVDILVYYKTPMPRDIDYAVLILLLGVEGFEFNFHLHGRHELDIHVHTLLIYAIIMNILGVILEMKYRNSLLAALTRSYGFFVQGTWFYQIGFTLYNPLSKGINWKKDETLHITMVTVYFVIHCQVIFLIMIGINSAVVCYHRCRSKRNKIDNNDFKMLLQHNVHNRESTPILMGESDDDNCL